MSLSYMILPILSTMLSISPIFYIYIFNIYVNIDSFHFLCYINRTKSIDLLFYEHSTNSYAGETRHSFSLLSFPLVNIPLFSTLFISYIHHTGSNNMTYHACRYLSQKKDIITYLLQVFQRRLTGIRKDDKLTIGIPGGRSVRYIIEALSLLPIFDLKHIQLVLVDERLSGERNRDTILQSGLEDLITKGYFSSDQLTEIDPNKRDCIPALSLVFLGVGEDGHAASLFPHSYPSLASDSTPVITHITDSPKPPSERITITYRGFLDLAADAEYFLMFFGEAKRNAWERCLLGESAENLPCAFFYDTMSRVTILTDLQRGTR